MDGSGMYGVVRGQCTYNRQSMGAAKLSQTMEFNESTSESGVKAEMKSSILKLLEQAHLWYSVCNLHCSPMISPSPTTTSLFQRFSFCTSGQA
jgi:hypothetical protein